MFSFGKRSVIKIGYSNYIAIPIIWAKNNNIKKGSKLNFSLTEEGNLLLKKELEVN